MSPVLLASIAHAAPPVAHEVTDAETHGVVVSEIPGLPGAVHPGLVDPGGLEGPGRRQVQIVNGELVGANEYTEVMHLGITKSDGSGGNCTGSLITPNWILTASHCVDGASPENGDTITASFGTSVTAPGGVTAQYEADFWVSHPDWRGTASATASGDFSGDVTVVHLVEPVTDVIPVALNQDVVDTAWIGTELTFVGYGITRFQGTDSGTKRKVNEPIIGIVDYEVRTFDGVHSTCQGDSGGPGFFNVGDAYVQVSVTSYGVGCGDGPSGHMRVDYYLDWIKEQILPDTVSSRPSAPPRFQCSNELVPGDNDTYAIGVTPLELNCLVDYYAPQEINKVTWEWGDGGIDEVTSAPFTTISHTYDDTGSHTVRMCVEGERDSGPWTHCMRRFGYARVCGVPDVAFGVEAVEGRTVQFVNRTDVSDYGCISDIQWNLFKGGGGGEPITTISAWQPQYTFEESGEYTAVLNVGGIGGTGGAKLTFDVTNVGRAGGCDHTGLGLGGVGAALGLAAVARRRRA